MNRAKQNAGPARPIDFQALFDALPTPYVLLDRDFAIVEMNQAYLDVAMRRRADLLGKNMFVAFPAEGESRHQLQAALEQARDLGIASHIPLLRYAIPRPESQGGGFEQRYWSCTHVPIRDEAGAVIYVLQNTQDVTEIQRLRDAAFPPRLRPEQNTLQNDMLQRVERVQELNRDLIAEYSRIHRLFMQAPGIMTLLSGPDHVIQLANRAFLDAVGAERDVLGKALRDAVPEVIGQGYIDILDRVFASGEAYVANAIRVMLDQEPGGSPTEAYFDAVFQPVTDAAGRTHGIFIEAIDVTHRVRAAERQALLMDELNHRVKNTLATVQAIAVQTLRNTAPERFAETFQARLSALARTHDALTHTRWEGAEMRALLQQELHPYRSARIALSGPKVSLAPRTALALGLIFHELTTNAAKYGALSVEDGRLTVAWSTQRAEDGCLALICDWREESGPPVSAPERMGFGSRLIEASIRTELEGTLTMDYARGGLTARFAIPLPAAATSRAAD